MRMLGAVTGLAVSTAVQYAVTQSALPDDSKASAQHTPGALADAKMEGVQAVFIIMVPLIALCGVSCLFVPSIVLEGDERQTVEREEAQRRD
jgi:hypothetical protein